MAVAILILAHNNPQNLTKLVESMDSDKYNFYIHIDKKVDISLYKQDLISFKNVMFLTQRFTVSWGGGNMIKATNELLRIALENQQNNLYQLVSGNDIYVEPTDSIFQPIVKSLPSWYILNSKVNQLEFNYKIDKWFFGDGIFTRKDGFALSIFIARILAIIISFLFKKNHSDIEYIKGSQWWCISKDMALLILSHESRNTGLYKNLKYSMCPDETLYHTILNYEGFKPDFQERYPANLIHGNHLINWADKQPSPDEISKNKLLEILKLKNKSFFVRKFNNQK